jgi:hypothetical protein
MSTIWAVQAIYTHPNPSPEPDKPTSRSESKIFPTQKEALAEYGKKVNGGLPADAKSAMIYLWESGTGPNGRVHSIVKHCHFWTDQNGTHRNEYSGAVQV